MIKMRHRLSVADPSKISGDFQRDLTANVIHLSKLFIETSNQSWKSYS